MDRLEIVVAVAARTTIDLAAAAVVVAEADRTDLVAVNVERTDDLVADVVVVDAFADPSSLYDSVVLVAEASLEGPVVAAVAVVAAVPAKKDFGAKPIVPGREVSSKTVVDVAVRVMRTSLLPHDYYDSPEKRVLDGDYSPYLYESD